ncbi:MAG: hypothetical protein QG635_830 [Bacteroidota bacterium]|nr:hypothetical protein [Bacteroidota bacterium]
MKNNYLLIKLLPVLILIAAIGGCNDEPSIVGYSFIPDTISIYGISSRTEKIISGAQSKFVQEQINNHGSILIGRNGAAIAVSSVRLAYIPDSLSWLKPDDIVSADLILVPLRFALGDTSGSNFLAFDIYNTLRLYDYNISYDSIFPPSGADPHYIDYSKVIGSYEGQIELKDTNTAISISIDKQTVSKWLAARPDSIIKYQNYGMTLVPRAGSTVIRQFLAQEVGVNVDTTFPYEPDLNMPYLYLKYKYPNGDAGEVKIRSGLDQSFISVPKPDNDNLYMQAAVSYEIEITFDLSAIPGLSSVHKAQLELTVNRDKCVLGNFPLDTVLDGLIMGKNIYRSDITINTFLGELSGDKYIFNDFSLFDAFQRWVKYGEKGRIIIRQYYNTRVKTTKKIAIYGLNAPDSSLMPVLKLIYSSRPKIQCK